MENLGQRQSERPLQRIPQELEAEVRVLGGAGARRHLGEGLQEALFVESGIGSVWVVAGGAVIGRQ